MKNDEKRKRHDTGETGKTGDAGDAGDAGGGLWCGGAGELVMSGRWGRWAVGLAMLTD